MKNQIDFKAIEEKWKKYWEKEKVYKFDSKSKKKIYSIDTPPPYISGNMHIGHAFSYSQQDFIIRFMRMKGLNVFYPFGTDDNGLPTERFIEKINKIKSKNMGRSKFIKLSLDTLKKVTPEHIQDFIDLGISCDYDFYYSTIDEHSQKVSQKSFIDLFKQKDIYKKNFPTIWCPECQTSIAQAELEDKEFDSDFSTLKFKCDTLKGTRNKDLLIATTRPELLGACVCVFVNPKDERYKKLVGKKAKVPLFNHEVPIIEDRSAEMDKGTGVLMVCSYGDKYDVDAINRHKLEPRVIFDKDGTLNIEKYKGMKIKEARKKILEDLKKGNLVKEQKKISHVVNVHDKCGTEIEYIPTEQWFIKIMDKKKKWIEQGRKINWYPLYMRKRYENWVNGLDLDWSISRNRHFGIPIPVWQCKKCNEIILPDEKELPVDPLSSEKKCSCGEIAEPEKMVLDTWATSSLTPQIAIELLSKDVQKKVFPMSLRPQAHDIIRTWAFYTIVKSYLHEKKIPWKDIVVSGNVSLGGEKMSKSKGNIVSPREVMDEYGADALRFWAAASKLGGDLDYQEKEVIVGKKFITKLKNASKFVFMNLEDYNGKMPRKLEVIDELFLSKLNVLIKNATESFEKYEYSKVKSDVEQFFWHDFCDNYLEIVKKRVYNEKGEKKISAQYVLYNSLLNILKMIAPIMPFVTEEIYQEHFLKKEKDTPKGTSKSIHVSSWPEEIKVGKVDDTVFDLMVDVLAKVRGEKTKAQKSMKAEINLSLEKKDFEKLKDVMNDLKDVAGAVDVSEGKFGVEFL
jgi:valyl-tRNA synthetase